MIFAVKYMDFGLERRVSLIEYFLYELNHRFHRHITNPNSRYAYISLKTAKYNIEKNDLRDFWTKLRNIVKH